MKRILRCTIPRPDAGQAKTRLVLQAEMPTSTAMSAITQPMQPIRVDCMKYHTGREMDSLHSTLEGLDMVMGLNPNTLGNFVMEIHPKKKMAFFPSQEGLLWMYLDLDKTNIC